MLSNPNNNLHNRQRQHRRQNSTPNAFEPLKVSNLPNIQRHGGHRRGMSLDTRPRQTPPQEHIHTNLGYQTTQSQHILRETQQQRLVRPGRQQFVPFDNDENYNNSPAVTPQRQSFDAGRIPQYGNRAQQPQYPYPGPLNLVTNLDSNSFTGADDFDDYSAEALTPSVYLDFSASFENASDGTTSGHHSRRSSSGRRISGGILDRVTQFEHMALQSPYAQRPNTPPNHNVTSYFPPTPLDTPHGRMAKHEQMNPRFMDDYDTTMEETVKPRGQQRARGIFDDMRKEAERVNMPTPPRGALAQTPSTFDSAPMPTGNFMNMSNMNLEFMKHEEGSQYSPVSSNISPSLSYNSSPEVSQTPIFGDPYANKPDLRLHTMQYTEPPAHGLPVVSSPMGQSPHRRSESVCSIDMNETITETGVTIDDIATFIQGPDALDGKWLCLFPDCKKRFGRKENIKSHVQTHLGDRQFQCPHCKKCFVRQHDLKRHAKIHSGVKPYPCQCGNSFARHDALTRHRQRGMCIGAFEGVVKKTVKRGRPRKNRPDDEDRVKKSSQTRSRNKAMSSKSSTCGGSESNGGQSPRSEADVLDQKPFGDYEFSQASSLPNGASFDYSQPQSPIGNECAIPQATTTPSPSAFSQHSHYDTHRGSISESIHLPSHPASPAKSIHSMHSYHSPPGLCDSSSSPAPNDTFYDCETDSQHGGMNINLNGLANISEHEDEMFLEAFAAAATNGEMTTLERDSDFSMAKFDESFNSNAIDNMYKNDADIFFGSP